MKVAHLADLHSNLRSRQEEAHRVLSWIVDDLRERQPDVILDAGDVFDVLPTPEEEDWTARFYRALADIAPVVGVTGNHAMGARPIPRLLLPADQAEPPTRHPITVLDRPGVVHVAGAAIACLPWPKRGHLMAATPGLGVDQRRTGGRVAVTDVLRGLGAELAAHDGPRILVAHAMVRSARVGHGQPLEVGQEFEIGLEDLALAGADYVALGHIHQRQFWQWKRDDGWVMWVVYPGSPFRTAFGETETKGYAIVEFDDPHELFGWKFVDTPAAPMLLVDEQWGTGGSDAHATWLQGLDGAPDSEAGYAGAEVRFRYRVPADQRDAAARAAAHVEQYLRERGAARVVVELEIIPTVRARAPEIASQSDLGAQWETWARSVAVEEARIPRGRAIVEELESEGAQS